MRQECFPQSIIDPAAAQELFKINRVLSPRVVDGFRTFPGCEISRGKSGLVKSVSRASKRLSSLSAQYVRQGLQELEFSNILLGTRIYLGDNFCDVTAKKLGIFTFQLINCSVCPIDRILRRLELVRHRQLLDSLFISIGRSPQAKQRSRRRTAGTAMASSNRSTRTATDRPQPQMASTLATPSARMSASVIGGPEYRRGMIRPP